MTVAFPPEPTAQTTGQHRRVRDYRRSTCRPPTLDVGLRFDDIRRLARRHPCWRACLAGGWTPEDLEAELAARIHARQSMGSRYDPAKASVGKYLSLLTGSILTNLSKPRKDTPTFCELDDRTADGALLPPIDDLTPIPEEPVPVADTIPAAERSKSAPKTTVLELQVEVRDVLVTVKGSMQELVEFVRALAEQQCRAA
ncbi:MAG: hypothetical protein KC621_32500 [Myxococcales bacterium]|nr:hypothetical protein [Myxococcales bacterium]